MPDFAQRFFDLALARSPLCVGLDPSRELFDQWSLTHDAEGLRRFCGAVLEAAGDRVAVFKPQSGFFERFGPDGMTQLARSVAAVRDQGALSLIDAKRGDVGGTMEGYAEAMIGPDSGFGGDAVTLTAYLGLDALRPIFDRAARAGAAVFVVVRSSNPEGLTLQDARLADGRAVADALADDITALNAAQCRGVGPIGAVMGATLDGVRAKTLSRLPRSLILAPGVGVQGASLEDLRHRFGSAMARTLPSVSRDILRHGPSIPGLREAMARYRDQAWAAIG